VINFPAHKRSPPGKKILYETLGSLWITTISKAGNYQIRIFGLALMYNH